LRLICHGRHCAAGGPGPPPGAPGARDLAASSRSDPARATACSSRDQNAPRRPFGEFFGPVRTPLITPSGQEKKGEQATREPDVGSPPRRAAGSNTNYFDERQGTDLLIQLRADSGTSAHVMVPACAPTAAAGSSTTGHSAPRHHPRGLARKGTRKVITPEWGELFTYRASRPQGVIVIAAPDRPSPGRRHVRSLECCAAEPSPVWSTVPVPATLPPGRNRP